MYRTDAIGQRLEDYTAATVNDILTYFKHGSAFINAHTNISGNAMLQ